jgi:hypothetical protein
MSQAKCTFTLERATLKRLQSFSRRSGVMQSVLVNQMVSRGLEHLAKNWRPATDLLDQAFVHASVDRGLAAIGKRAERQPNGNGKRHRLQRAARGTQP